ncbi:hypothetical protein Pogu_0008 [Pyrobaculum oguniense TE7]|uniref:Uncharacterized protein n=1 Tax=Pyrobaculum oguniense (strain DSM 13380 / JCM 10595 / TE7) TaxID=698757 RepID=H6Q605_PYROT|nr:hypothetical protein Pogu_0008 [Pyrobaculum oguniense TE7]
MERLSEILKIKMQPLNANSLKGTDLTVERVKDLAARYEFEPFGVASLLSINVAGLADVGDVASAIREFLQNAMNAQCGPRIMCKPLIEYRDGELLITKATLAPSVACWSTASASGEAKAALTSTAAD